MIPVDLIKQYGGVELRIKKDQILFFENQAALHYYQIIEGAIMMVNYSQDGQEFIQGIFGPVESFGEPPLFADFPYPSDAIATTDSVLIRLRKESFLHLLKDHFEIHLKFSRVFSQRLKYKSMILREISSYAPEHRILTLINYFKEKSGRSGKEKYQVPYTRQQIADMTGLRVETVIRSVGKLKEDGKISLVNHKIFAN